MRIEVCHVFYSETEFSAHYERLQDHLSHIVDARSAVAQLREDSDRRKKEQLEAEQRMRQAQMKQTLDLMRMKKHVWFPGFHQFINNLQTMLLEQRDVALQRFQQQEQEMQARRHQQPIYAAPGGMPPHNPYGNQGPVYSVPYYHNNQQSYAQQNPQVSAQMPHPYAPGIVFPMTYHMLFQYMLLPHLNISTSRVELLPHTSLRSLLVSLVIRIPDTPCRMNKHLS